MTFALSTSEYNRSPSPIATDEERLIFKKNEEKLRIKIEEELIKIPKKEQKNLNIYVKKLNNDYVEQTIYVKILKNTEKFHISFPNEKDFEKFNPQKHYENYNKYIDYFQDIWLNFDYSLFDDKIYLQVSYNNKDIAKKLGAKWDVNKKLWYSPDNTYTDLLNQFS